MESQLKELFAAFGLSNKEQLVLETLIHRGNQPASRIAKSLSLARNTTRNILDRLVELGLVARSKRSNSHIYRVESIQSLTRNLTEQSRENERRLAKQIKSLKSLEPLLKDTTKHSKKPMVQFYEGLEGAERVYEDTLSAHERIRAWASFDANSKALPEYFERYYKRRAKLKIGIRSIHPDTALARERVKHNKAEKRQAELLPESIFKIDPEVQVYDNKINLVSWSEEFGILIESKELANGLKSIFDLCYSLARHHREIEST